MIIPKGYVDETTMRFTLARLCEASSQVAVARRYGYSPQYIHDVLAGRRAVSADLAAMMGFQRLVLYRINRPVKRA